MIIREDNIRGTNGHYLFKLLAQFKRGDCDGVKVRIGRLQVRLLPIRLVVRSKVMSSQMSVHIGVGGGGQVRRSMVRGPGQIIHGLGEGGSGWTHPTHLPPPASGI